MAGPALILFILGADRDDQIQIAGRKFGIAGASDIHQLLDKREPRHRMLVTRNFLRQQRRPELGHYSCLLNLITEAEHNGRVLENLRKLLRDTRGRVINPPEAVLKSTRDQVARRLAGIPDLHVPKAIRLRAAKPAQAVQLLERSGVPFPIILRQTGTHTGDIVGRFDGPDGIQEGLAQGSEFIATEFVDFRSADGFYRKYRVFFIGQQIIFRHMLASDQWNVHAKDRRGFMAGRPELLEEEERLFARTEGAFPPAVLQTLEAVRERMGLDYFGMDFGIGPDGRVVLFEANATMNFFPFLADPIFAYVQRCLPPAQRAFRELLGLEPEAEGTSRTATDLEPAR